MANKSQRIGAALLALLFLLSSVATAGYVIWQINNEEPVATGTSQDDSTLTSDDQNQGSLQGTPLADFTPRSEPVAAIESTDSVVGTGTEATAASTVTVNYTLAKVSDGLVIESSFDTGEPLTQPLSALIEGWKQGVPGMKEGGKRRLIIPSALAYNNGDLVFDIELIDVR